MPDFGFVGAAYEAPSIYQDAQECINFYPEIDPTKGEGSRGIVSLYPTCGLEQVLQLNVGEVRGMRALSGGQYLIVVSGAIVYKVDTTMTATQIGVLLSTTGMVSITDNQMTVEGLTAYIVDGANRYYWVAESNSFQVMPSTDGPWQGATVCDVLDNYILYTQPNTQNFAATDLGSPLSTAAYYGTKDGAPDNIVGMIVDHRQIYLLGEKTTEVWVDVGSLIQGVTTFPFQRISGTTMQRGCAAKYSVTRFGDAFLWVTKDERGKAMIGSVNGYQFLRVSTHAVENSLVGYDVSDARAYTFQIEGHEFYVVTFPTANITWVYDLATQQWHKWLYWNNAINNGSYQRHRTNCGAFFNGMNLAGDYENGKIYKLSQTVYTDNNDRIRRVRRAPHLVTDLQRQYFHELQIQFQPGVGVGGLSIEDHTNVPDPFVIAASEFYNIAPEDIVWIGNDLITTVTDAANPEAMLRWSNDGGSTWSNEHWVSIGKQGKYKNRAIWRRLGWSRDRIFEVAVSSPVKAVIISANLKASDADN